jgi:hypothetical protein
MAFPNLGLVFDLSHAYRVDIPNGLQAKDLIFEFGDECQFVGEHLPVLLGYSSGLEQDGRTLVLTVVLETLSSHHARPWEGGLDELEEEYRNAKTTLADERIVATDGKCIVGCGFYPTADSPFCSLHQDRDREKACKDHDQRVRQALRQFVVEADKLEAEPLPPTMTWPYLQYIDHDNGDVDEIETPIVFTRVA